MGVDLTLIPVDNIGDFPYGHSLIDMVSNYAIFDVIENIERDFGRDVPLKFSSFRGHQENGEHGYGETSETPYGKPLKMVPTKKLAEIESEGMSPRNKAVFAYLTHEPTEWTALYWH